MPSVCQNGFRLRLYYASTHGLVIPTLEDARAKWWAAMLQVPGFTLTRARGMWQGHAETSCVIESYISVQTAGELNEILPKMCEAFSEEFDEDCVMYVIEPANVVFAGRKPL